MFRLLNIEIHKLKNSRASIILIITYFVLLTSIALIAAIKFDIGPIQFHLAEQGIFNFPYIWHFNTFIAAFFKLFLLLVIVSMMANEYSNKTLKQNLIDGLSKKEFILSKFYTVVLFAFISTIFVFIVSIILGMIYSDYNEVSIIFSDLEYLVAFFVKLMGFFSFGLFLGMLIKRSAFAVGAMLIWFFAETIGYNILKWNVFKGTDIADNIFQFAPLKAMWNLIDEPFSRLNAVRTLASQIGEDISAEHGVQFYEILIVLGWTFIFIYGSYYLLKIRDL
jgi:ABC-type transport system involved in multi-copper enzyme maturation permease subunit